VGEGFAVCGFVGEGFAVCGFVGEGFVVCGFVGEGFVVGWFAGPDLFPVRLSGVSRAAGVARDQQAELAPRHGQVGA
jgi:hypothetical protein